jgi:hypothetical protein
MSSKNVKECRVPQAPAEPGTAEASAEMGLTVAQALATRAARLKAVLDWARVRLDRAAALAEFTTEPSRPEGAIELHLSAEALSLAELATSDIREAIGDYREAEAPPDITALIEFAFGRWGNALTEEEMELWEMDAVADLTVAELKARLDLTREKDPRPQPQTSKA